MGQLLGGQSCYSEDPADALRLLCTTTLLLLTSHHSTTQHHNRTLIIVKNYTGDVLQFGLARVSLARISARASRTQGRILFLYRSAGPLHTSARTRSACSSSVRLRSSSLFLASPLTI